MREDFKDFTVMDRLYVIGVRTDWAKLRFLVCLPRNWLSYRFEKSIRFVIVDLIFLELNCSVHLIPFAAIW
jgi:hypothetical protein